MSRKANMTTTIKSKDYIYNLKMREVILRQDGGALFVGETYYTSSKTVPRSSFDTFNVRQAGLNYHYNDLVVLSINPDGSLLWDEVLKKRQYSEEDKGYYSSFGMVNSGNALNFIFNEEISNNTNVNNYKMDSTGEHTIESMMNVYDYNVMIAPRYYKQTSPTEIVMPAFNKKNEFLLLKIGF